MNLLLQRRPPIARGATRRMLEVLALLFLASSAMAQLDLPSKARPLLKRPAPSLTLKSGKGGSGMAPYLLCVTCGDRNYTTAIDPSITSGTQKAWCNTCTSARPHTRPTKAPALALPKGHSAAASGEAASKSATGFAASDLSAASSLTSAILLVWGSVTVLDETDDPIALGAVSTLLAFGEPGVGSAREHLTASHGPTRMTAARVLLRSGQPADADRVVASLRKRMPSDVGPKLLTELASLDPVRATPRLFCELLDHPQFPVRAMAERLLSKRLDPSVTALLAPALESTRGDTRYRAVDLLARIEDPGTTDPLLAHIADPRAKVAWRSAEALARSDDPRVPDRLLKLAFGERWILRESSYAILALVEREDYRLEAIMSGDHVPALLRGLSSNDPFVSGACATALAGIGFRSARSADSPWLDREVPEQLLSAVVGDVFFDDYSSLKVPSLRRLEQIAGVSFGSRGPSWAAWWVEQDGQFHASCAVLTVPEGAEGNLEVRFQAGGGAARAVVLLGPDRPDPIGAPGEVFYLNTDEARDYLALLRREGVLGRDRLPGIRGSQSQRGRKLEVHVGAQSKAFVFGADVSEPWFERAVQMVDALVARNLWQRFPHPADHLGSRRTLWQAEHGWWRQTHDEHERALGLKGLVLGRLPVLLPVEREADLDELERLYREEQAAEISDFAQIVALILDETYYSGTVRKLVALARRAAGLEPPFDQEDEQRVKLANDLVTLLFDEFDAAAADDISALIGLQGAAAVRTAAVDGRALIRAIAAGHLASSASGEDHALLLDLMADEDPRVEVAAVIAAGRERVEGTRVELLLRARDPNPDIKQAALRAIGFLGGENALDALVSGLADGDPEVRVAAAEGLSELADPSVSSLLVSLLRQGSSSAVFDPARRGLLNLGEQAWDELFVALRSSSPGAQREAALLLAYQGCPEAASTLMRVLSQNPEDGLVEGELVILTCVDNRSELDPAEAWWSWWDKVRHDDSMSWLIAAAERRAIPGPDPGAFDDGGSEAGVAFLIRLMAREESWLAERARRELIRTAGHDIGSLPAAGIERDLWLGTLYEVLTDTRD
ncbi:MAG: HEAT repeat protein [Chlamydiales bacterium]|jgi:HEAT repeat protein